MILFIILMASGLITLEDRADFWGDILNIRDGVLSRMQYFGCTWISSFAIGFIGSIFLTIIGVNSGPRGIGYFLAYGILYLILTVMQLSAFFRRMNDACLSKWYALVFLLPVVGNFLAFIIALMPSGFGDPY